MLQDAVNMSVTDDPNANKSDLNITKTPVKTPPELDTSGGDQSVLRQGGHADTYVETPPAQYDTLTEPEPHSSPVAPPIMRQVQLLQVVEVQQQRVPLLLQVLVLVLLYLGLL